MITDPGFYPDMPIDEYHSDPCPAPSLTQSIAKIILDRSPLHAWHEHPRLNPSFERNTEFRFDLGTAAHAMLIGRGKTIEPIPYENYLTKAAKAAREELAAAGKQAVTMPQYERALAMTNAAVEQLNDFEHGSIMFNSAFGDGEIVMAWQEDGFWFRQMIDFLSTDRRLFVDYKTTDQNAAPQNLGKLMHNAGWPIQAAMAQRGLDVLSPNTAGLRRYLFVVQEATPPFALQVCEMSGPVLQMGRKALDMAASIWLPCLRANDWPAYPLLVQRPELPQWAESQWLEREIAHHEREQGDV